MMFRRLGTIEDFMLLRRIFGFGRDMVMVLAIRLLAISSLAAYSMVSYFVRFWTKPR